MHGSAVRFLLVLLLALAPAFANERNFQPRPFKQGVSCGPTLTAPFITAGTCGARVTSFLAPTLRLILGSAHVFAAVGSSLCPNTAPQFTWVLQPGTLDLGFDPGRDPTYLAGVLAGSIPIDFAPAASNLVDAALLITASEWTSTEILNIGEPLEQFAEPLPGLQVIKNGRTTSLTTGTVEAVNVTTFVNYGNGCGTARFVDQVSISPATFSEGGDSGAVILRSDTKAPVALLFAGSSTRTLANRIFNVYNSLAVFIEGRSAINQTAETAASLTRRARQVLRPEVARLRAVQARHENALLANPDVTGVGIGLAANGDGYALVVFVGEGSAARVARAMAGNLEGAPVRFVESGAFQAR